MDMEQLLVGCLSNDNATRQLAEQAVKAAAKQPAVVPELLGRVGQSAEAQVRQLAAVLLRKRISGHWRKLAPETREAVKDGLLAAAATEPEPAVRRALGEAIAALARVSLPRGEWPALLPWLAQCGGAPEASHRELALAVLAALLDSSGEFLRPHLPALAQRFGGALADGAPRVRSAALRASAALLPWLASEEEVRLFRALLPGVLQVARDCLTRGEEETAIQAFAFLTDVVECPAPLLGPVLPAVVTLAMEAAASAQYDLNTREQALQVVHWLARYKPKQLARAGQVAAIVRTLCTLCTEPDPPGHDEDTAQLPAAKFASQAIDSLALNLPAKHVFPEVLAFARGAISSAQPLQRTAACTVLVVTAEGCAEAARKRLNEVLQVVVAGLGDSEPRVRGAAAVALGQLAEHCQPAILDLADHLLPRICAALADPAPDVVQHACYALDAFVENMEEEQVQGYLDPIMSCLMPVLQSGSAEARLTALSAVAAAAAAGGSQFGRYAAVLLPLLRSYMDATADEALAARARATECIGLLARALGAEAMAPLVPDIMEAALRGLELGYSELTEYAHGLFGHLAQLLGEQFAPWLPRVVPAALASCQQDDGTVLEDDTEGQGSAAAAGASEDEEDDAVGRLRTFGIRTGVLDEKAAAVQALGIYAAETRAAFMPYLEAALGTIRDMAVYFHEDVREQAHEALEALVLSVAHCFPGPAAGTPSPQLQHVVDTAMPLFVAAMTRDTDKAAATTAVHAAGEVLRVAGAGAVSDHLAGLAAAAGALLAGKAACQREDGSEEEGQDSGEEEEGAAEEELLAATAELLPVVAAAVGAAVYAPLFGSSHLPALLGRCRASQPEGVRAAAMGAIAELVRELGSATAPAVDSIVPVVVRELRSGDAGGRRNAAFCAGLLAAAAPGGVAGHLGHLLQALHPLFGPEEEDGTRDNAVGAVARMLAAFAPQMPLDQVLPVLLGALPLREDLEEAGPVYGALAQLATSTSDARVQPHLPALIQAFGMVAVQETAASEVRHMAARAVAHVHDLYGEPVHAYIVALPAEQQQALKQLASEC